MTALTSYRPAYRPGLLGRSVFDDVFDNVFTDFPQYLKRSTQGYPVADIYRTENGDTVMQFALAGFSKEDLNIEVKPEKRSITVSATTGVEDESESGRRIARRNFQKTYINYDDNLDLGNLSASFENGLLTVTVPTAADVKPLMIEIK